MKLIHLFAATSLLLVGIPIEIVRAECDGVSYYRGRNGQCVDLTNWSKTGSVIRATAQQSMESKPLVLSNVRFESIGVEESQLAYIRGNILNQSGKPVRLGLIKITLFSRVTGGILSTVTGRLINPSGRTTLQPGQQAEFQAVVEVSDLGNVNARNVNFELSDYL